jgi:hypothetical protein
VLQTPVANRLIDPGSEWRLRRHWFDASAMGDLLSGGFAPAEKNTLYRCLHKLVEYKDARQFQFLVQRWGELFGAKFDVLPYDRTSTYSESDVERGPSDLRPYGYSRDTRGDCRQVVIALIVFINRAFAGLPGRPSDAAVGRELHDITPTDRAETLRTGMDRARRAGTGENVELACADRVNSWLP